MRLSAILQARVLAFIELYDLDPRGRVFLPDAIKLIQQRYGFLEVPKVDDASGEKGVELKTGKLRDLVIDVFKIFPTLFVLETHSNTSNSKLILEDIFEWGKQALGLTYEPRMIRHWAYVSTVTFYSDVNLISQACSPAERLAAKTTTAVSEIWGEPVTYESRYLALSHDPLARKNGIASFMIQPRQETPYSKNKFYSDAPLPTDQHIKLLEEFEADVLATSAANGPRT